MIKWSWSFHRSHQCPFPWSYIWKHKGLRCRASYYHDPSEFLVAFRWLPSSTWWIPLPCLVQTRLKQTHGSLTLRGTPSLIWDRVARLIKSEIKPISLLKWARRLFLCLFCVFSLSLSRQQIWMRCASGFSFGFEGKRCLGSNAA